LYTPKGGLDRKADPLSVLAPYRSFGLGAALLKSALSASIHPSTPPPPAPPKDKPATRAALVPAKPRKAVNRAMAHVQVGNEGAKRFYERLGFVEKERYVLINTSFKESVHGKVE
jgi:GNAT superfamily N-acetyltransferase